MQQLPQVLQRLEEDWVALAGKHKASQCFVEVHAQLEVHLHPFFMGDRLAWGLRKAAGELLLKFNQALGCMPLTIADLTPAGSRHGAIVAESPYVHFLASFHTVGFAPKKGQHLVGRITDIQHQGRLNLQVLGSIHSYAMKQSLPEAILRKGRAGNMVYGGAWRTYRAASRSLRGRAGEANERIDELGGVSGGVLAHHCQGPTLQASFIIIFCDFTCC